MSWANKALPGKDIPYEHEDGEPVRKDEASHNYVHQGPQATFTSEVITSHTRLKWYLGLWTPRGNMDPEGIHHTSFDP